MSIRNFQEFDYSAICNIDEDSKLDELRFEESLYVFIPLVGDDWRCKELNELDIYVDSDVRGRGIGTAMLTFFILKNKGEISMDIAKNNLPAKCFMKKVNLLLLIATGTFLGYVW